jgi:hypothetical protein
VLGYPIRKPPDQRSVANSPGHIAGSHVLHRLLMPRHPPCALKNLNTTKNKMLAFTMQFSKHERTPTLTPPPNHQRQNPDAVWRPGQPARSSTPHQPDRSTRNGPKRQTDSPPPESERPSCPFPQDPTVCPAVPPASDGFPGPRRAVLTSLIDETDRVASAPPMSGPTRETFAHGMGLDQHPPNLTVHGVWPCAP